VTGPTARVDPERHSDWPDRWPPHRDDYVCWAIRLPIQLFVETIIVISPEIPRAPWGVVKVSDAVTVGDSRLDTILRACQFQSKAFDGTVVARHFHLKA
jgi:hypothetical protein